MEMNGFFTTFRPTLVGAWIPVVAMVLVQFVCMAIFKEGGKRAVDTSWYDAKTKMYAQWNSIFQVLVIILAVFVPFKCGTPWFTVGAVVYVMAFALFMWSFHSYGTADRDKLITKGIYKYSRNPMYAVFTLAMVMPHPISTPTRLGRMELPTVMVSPMVPTFPGCTSGITLITLPSELG